MQTTRSHPLSNGLAHHNEAFDPVRDFEESVRFGEEQSAKVNGDPQMLLNFLFMFYDADHETANLRQEIAQLEKTNAQYRADVKEFQGIVESLRNSMHTNNRERDRLINEKQNVMAGKQVEIKRIKGGDYKLLGTDANPANRMAYVMAAGILAVVTIYLICFYASVIYNAFLLDPVKLSLQQADNDIISSITITNVKAISQVNAEFGFWGVLFLLSGTFVFITLGFLVHWFAQSRNRIWIYVLYIFTFLFDAMLAYEIVRKIHISQYTTGAATEVWKYILAFQSMEFYIILFAGFGIYIAWGLLLRYLLEEHHKILPSRSGIRTRRAEIDRIRQEIKDTRDHFDGKSSLLQTEIIAINQREIGARETEIENNEIKIRSLSEKMREHLQQAGISAQKLRARITAFLTGWCNSIIKTMPKEDAERTQKLCHDFVNHFYQTVGL